MTNKTPTQFTVQELIDMDKWDSLCVLRRIEPSRVRNIKRNAVVSVYPDEAKILHISKDVDV